MTSAVRHQFPESLKRGFDHQARGDKWIVTCKRCRARWEMTMATSHAIHPGHVLALLDHEASHVVPAGNRDLPENAD